jgi:hypothetical protein
MVASAEPWTFTVAKPGSLWVQFGPKYESREIAQEVLKSAPFDRVRHLILT